MTIERVDSIRESLANGVSRWGILRGVRTRTQVHPDQIVWTDGRITKRFTQVKKEEQDKFSNGLLVIDSDNLKRLAMPGTRTRMDMFQILSKEDINRFAEANPSFRLQWSPSRRNSR